MLAMIDDTKARQALETAQREMGGTIVGDRLMPLAPLFGQLSGQEAAGEDDGQWYVLIIQPLQERKAAAHLIGRRFRPYLPVLPRVVCRGRARARITVEWPMFPGYLPVKINFQREGARLHHIYATPGVHRFLEFEDGAGVIPKAEIERIRKVEQNERARLDRKLGDYDVDEEVRVTEGPFRGFSGRIVELDDGGRITLLISLLGRATPIHMRYHEIEKL